MSPQFVQAVPFEETWICQYTRFGAIAGTVIAHPDKQAVPDDISLSKLYGDPLVLQASARPLQ